ncbi:MAG: hypothetical protein H8E44_23650 [Planctomycetes bacterium]|nr:hypothetical protein [Planctomycetota bacterium]MBL7039868.1 hypothetical protein [Pirellulaceae bacterium]
MPRVGNVTAIVGALIVGVSGCGEPTVNEYSKPGSQAPSNSLKDKYKGHRILLWSFDRKTHAGKGFAQGTIEPGKKLELEPLPDYVVTFQAGEVHEVEVFYVHNPQNSWLEEHVNFKVSHKTGSAEGTKGLDSPFVHFEWGYKTEIDSVAFVAPLGTIDLPALSEQIRRDCRGNPAELEDLLLVAAFEPRFRDYLGMYEVFQIYKILGKTTREARWVELLESDHKYENKLASAVLMCVGNKAGEEMFCDASLNTRGNVQISYIEFLCGMPASDKALETIVQLIVSPGIYKEKVGEGVGKDIYDLRRDLLRALSEKYSPEKVRPYLDEIVKAADANEYEWYVQDALDRLLIRGVWRCASREGHPVPVFGTGRKIVISGEEITADGTSHDYRLTTHKEPRHLDLGIEAESQQAEYEGIYLLDAHTLKLCLGENGTARPTKFSVEDADKTVLCIFERISTP